MRLVIRWFAATCSLLCFLGGLAATPAGAQESAPAASPRAMRVRALNNSLLLLHGQMEEGAPSNRADSIRSEAATVIAQRAAALTALIKENPRQALSFAFSPDLLADLKAKFPQSAGLLESHGTWQGP